MSDEEPKDTKPETKEEREDDKRDDQGDEEDRGDDKDDGRDRDDDQDRKRRDDSRSQSRGRGRRSRSRSRTPRRKSRDRSRDRSGDSDRAKKFGDDCYGRKLYVGNLDFRTDREYLEDKFRKFGPIEDVFIPLDGRGDSRGFAFVTFEDRRDAEDAVEDMHDSRLDGRRITCNVARPRPPLRGGGGRDRSRSPGRGPGQVSAKIYIGNLPMDVREHEIEDMYKKFGHIVRIDLKTPNRPPAYAFVEYEDERDAEDALRETNGTKFGRDTIRVEFSRARRR